MVDQLEAGTVAGMLDDPGEVAGPGEALDPEGVGEAPNHLGDIRVRVLEMGEPVGAAQDHRDVRMARQGEHLSFVRLRYRAVDPWPSVLVDTDPGLGESVVI